MLLPYSNILIALSLLIGASQGDEDQGSDESGELQKLCIEEKNLNMTELTMVHRNSVSGKTLQACVAYCLKEEPDKELVLISYYNAPIVGDQFNCLCATEEAIVNTVSFPENKCRIKCPKQKNKRCGDADNDRLSVYCLQRTCHQPSKDKPLCHQRLPHDSHGCISNSHINWQNAHNVKNFTATGGNSSNSAPDATDCVWECRERHKDALYSLTRTVDNELMCSCGYDGSLDSNNVVHPEFCAMLQYDLALTGEKKGQKTAYYTLNCVGDLNDKTDDTSTTSTTTTSTTTSSSSTSTTEKPSTTTTESAESENIPDNDNPCPSNSSIGCINEDKILQHHSKIEISGLKRPTPEDCKRACASTFSQVDRVGVRWDPDQSSLHCTCLPTEGYQSADLDSSTTCEQPCSVASEEYECGSSSNKSDLYLSLYCGLEQESSVARPLVSEEGLSVLRSIKLALKRDSALTSAVVAILTILCILLISMVTYLCYTRGISSLSRYVM